METTPVAAPSTIKSLVVMSVAEACIEVEG